MSMGVPTSSAILLLFLVGDFCLHGDQAALLFNDPRVVSLKYIFNFKSCNLYYSHILEAALFPQFQLQVSLFACLHGGQCFAFVSVCCSAITVPLPSHDEECFSTKIFGTRESCVESPFAIMLDEQTRLFGSCMLSTSKVPSFNHENLRIAPMGS